MFPGYVTNSSFPRQEPIVVQPNWDRPADYLPPRTQDASMHLTLVYWNRAKLEEGCMFVCPVGRRNQDRLERLLTVAYRVEDTLVHGKRVVEELKEVFKQLW